MAPQPSPLNAHWCLKHLIHITDLINSNQPAETIIRYIATSLHKHIPFDRFTFQLPRVAHLYKLENEQYEARYALSLASDRPNVYASQWVLINQKPLLRQDIPKERRFEFDEQLISEGMRADLIIPLLHNQTLLGIINFTSKHPNSFTQKHLEMILSAQETFAVVAQHLETYQETQALNKLSFTIQHTLNLNHIIDLALKHLRSQGYDRARLYLYDATQKVFVGKSQRGPQPMPQFEETNISIQDDPYSQQTLTADKPCIYQTNTELFLNNNQKHAYWPQMLDKNAQQAYTEWCEIILQITEEDQKTIIGKICVDNCISQFPLVADRLNRLTSYANQLAQTIRHAQLYEQASQKTEYLEAQIRNRTLELGERSLFQSALVNIGAAVQTMNVPNDIEHIIQHIFAQLQTLSINFQAISVNQLLDEEKEKFEVYHLSTVKPLFKEIRFSKSKTEKWKTQKAAYRNNIKLDLADEYPAYRQRVMARFGLPIRSSLSIPFPQGFLTLLSISPNAFTQQHITFMQQVTDLLSVGITRSKDLQQLSDQTQEHKNLIADLEAKNTELERFTYTVSHDLKAPLITIKGFLSMVEKDAKAGDHQRLNADLNFIRHAADNMEHLLNDLLELSRIGRITNPSEHIPLTELVHNVVHLLSAHIQQHGVDVRIAPNLPTVYGDRQRLQEVFQNLIDNAIKFMGDQKSPQIDINIRLDHGEKIIYIKDNGQGITPANTERIFNLFERLNTQTQGTGIGLALVRRIIEHHNGRIWVESKGIGHGATFCFTLPPNTTT